MEKENKRYEYRHIARIVVEAATPIAVGSGASDVVTDSPVVKDINGLPYIPGTSLAGVIRHALELGRREDETNFFGYHDKDGGRGSRIIFTDAVMIGKDGLAVDGICQIDPSDDFYGWYQELPVRNHVRINEHGVNDRNGKFDNEVVYMGTRFVFEIELLSDQENDSWFDKTLATLYRDTMRIGGGTRCGYGKMKVVRCLRADLNLTEASDLAAYIKKPSCLSEKWTTFAGWQPSAADVRDDGWITYTLRLQPQDFFLFGSGFGDDDADNTPAVERVVEWGNGKPCFSQQRTLVPASSVKGALAHRTAYNYNKQNRLFIGNENACAGDDNPAVAAVFGSADGDGQSRGSRGNIIMSDVIGKEKCDKLFFHVKNDYFSGGTIDGALFQEKSVFGRDTIYEEEILVRKDVLEDTGVREALEQSLKDICSGLLPLGGCVGRGNGFFTGELLKDGGKI